MVIDRRLSVFFQQKKVYAKYIDIHFFCLLKAKFIFALAHIFREHTKTQKPLLRVWYALYDERNVRA